MVTSDRGQAHTLEAIVASILLLSSVLFALQITAVTPLSASTSNQHIENQQQASAEGILSMAEDNGYLMESLLYWNQSSQRFYNGTVNGYYTQSMPTRFGSTLERAFADRGIAYNVYLTTFGTNERERMIYQGEPSDNAVSASRLVVITDGTYLLDEDKQRDVPITNTNFYADDVGAGKFYTAVRVEVVVWRI